MRHCAKFRRNGWIRGRDMVIFRFFNMAASAILEFWNLKFLTVWTVKRIELRLQAKFRQNRLNCSQNITIFFYFFSKMAAVRHLGFVMRVSEPPTKGFWWSLSLQNMAGIDAVVLIICTFFEFGLITPIHAPIFGVFNPINGSNVKKSQKAHFCASPLRLSYHAWKFIDGSGLYVSSQKGA